MITVRRKKGCVLAVTLLLGALFLSGSQALAQEEPRSDTIVGPALKAAYGQDLSTAHRLLLQLSDSDNADPLVLWNLAAVQVRQDRLGAALVTYMRLLKAELSSDMRTRTKFWKKKIQDRLLERARLSGSPEVLTLRDPRTFSQKWVEVLPDHGWRWLSLVSFWALLLFWLVQRSVQGRMKTISVLLSGLFLMSWLVSVATEWVESSQGQEVVLGAVTEAQAEFRESLVEGAPVQLVPEGVVFVVTSSLTSKTLYVRLPDGRTGYVLADQTQLVK